MSLLLDSPEGKGRSDVPRVLCVRSEVHAPRIVRVSVEDTGKGVEPGAIDQIADLQPTVHDQTARHGDGAVDLPVTIEAHEGQLWVTANLTRRHFSFHGAAHPGSAS